MKASQTVTENRYESVTEHGRKWALKHHRLSQKIGMKASQTVTENGHESITDCDRNYNGTVTDRDRHSLERAIDFVLLQNAIR